MGEMSAMHSNIDRGQILWRLTRGRGQSGPLGPPPQLKWFFFSREQRRKKTFSKYCWKRDLKQRERMDQTKKTKKSNPCLIISNDFIFRYFHYPMAHVKQIRWLRKIACCPSVPAIQPPKKKWIDYLLVTDSQAGLLAWAGINNGYELPLL